MPAPCSLLFHRLFVAFFPSQVGVSLAYGIGHLHCLEDQHLLGQLLGGPAAGTSQRGSAPLPSLLSPLPQLLLKLAVRQGADLLVLSLSVAV